MGKEIDKAELAAKIQSIKELDSDTRAALLALVNGRKKYGLVWEEQTENANSRLCDEIPVLIENKELFITSGNANVPNHILIEGDNLHALTALTYTHKDKIDVIYIDPPYNTGKEFVYNDDYKDKGELIDLSNPFRHSKWLSFMSKRLNIAKKLLSNSGLIWISIDENELFNLKMLCDDIFASDNFRSLITVIANPGGRDYGGIAKTTEYILVYAKSPVAQINKVADSNHTFKLHDEYGPFELRELRNRNTKFNIGNRPNLCYPFYVAPNIIDKDGLYSVALEPDEHHTVEVMPLKSKGIQTVWRWGKEERSRRNLNINIKGKLKTDGTYMIVEKYRDEYVMIKNIWNDKKFRTEQGSVELTDIFDEKVFDYPKPIEIPHLVLETLNKKDACVLDFFAGSGTTLHATMQLNEEDGGHRQCILVTNNENNICRDITYERNRRVIQGYTNSKGVDIPGLTANKLHYFHTDFVERQSSVTAKKKLMAAATDMLCIKNNIYTKQTNFNGKAYREKDVRYFAEGDNQMLIIYNIDIIEEIINEIDKMEVTKPIIVYVFSTNDYAYDADFADVQSKVNLCALPEAIYRAYLQVLPQRNLI